MEDARIDLCSAVDKGRLNKEKKELACHLMLVHDSLRQQSVVGEEAGVVQLRVVVTVASLHRVRR